MKMSAKFQKKRFNQPNKRTTKRILLKLGDYNLREYLKHKCLLSVRKLLLDKGKISQNWVISKILFMNFNEDITFQYKKNLLKNSDRRFSEKIINVNL